MTPPGGTTGPATTRPDHDAEGEPDRMRERSNAGRPRGTGGFDEYAALADPTRRHLLMVLANGARTVGELAAGLKMSQPAVSQHLRVLRESGLVTYLQVGKNHRYQLRQEWIGRLRRWLDRLDTPKGRLADRTHPADRLLPGEDRERLARARRSLGRVTTDMVFSIERLIAHCRRLDDTYGQEAVMPVVEGQRELTDHLLRKDSLLPGVRDRLLHAYAELSQMAGFLRYDAMDHTGATEAFHDCITAADACGDSTLAAYAYHWLSDMSCFAGQPVAALRYADAAQERARRSGSNLLRARTDFVESWALAINRRESESLRRLESALARPGRPASAEPSYLYWVNESRAVEATACFVFNALGRAEDTITAVTGHLATCGPEYRRERALAQLNHSEALLRKRDLAAARVVLDEAAAMMGEHSSVRLAYRLAGMRRRVGRAVPGRGSRPETPRLALGPPPAPSS